MDKELLQATYDQIQLNEEQEARILAKLEQEQKKSSANRMKSWAQRAAVIVASVLVLSSATVYAAKEFGIAELMSQRYSNHNQQAPAYTQQEKALYEKLGTLLNKEIELETGTMILEAVIYDSNNIIVPYTYIREKGESAKETTKDYEEVIVSREASEGYGVGVTIDNYLKDEERGCFREQITDGEHVKQGDQLTIRIRKHHKTGKTTESIEDEIIDTIVLEKDNSGLTKKVIDEKYELNSGMALTDVTVTPLSVSITTAYQKGKYYPYSSVNAERIKIVRKNGSVLGENELASWEQNGGNLISNSSNKEVTETSLYTGFTKPIDPEELDYIQIELADETFRIPIN